MSKSRRARFDMQDYDNQRYIAADLDDNYFDALNSHTDILYCHGAMDAIEMIPCGSMVSLEQGNLYDRSVIERGITLEEKLRIDDEMQKIFDSLDD